MTKKLSLFILLILISTASEAAWLSPMKLTDNYAADQVPAISGDGKHRNGRVRPCNITFITPPTFLLQHSLNNRAYDNGLTSPKRWQIEQSYVVT